MKRTEYGHLMQPGLFLDKVISDIDFTNEAVVQFDAQVRKILLDDGDIQKITNKF